MPRRGTIRFVSLRSCLVNLPIWVYGPLVEHQIRPQSLAVHLSKTSGAKAGNGNAVFAGWTGMAAASSLAMWNSSRDEGHLETIEIDPQFAASVGLAEGETVEIGLLHDLPIAKSVSTEPLTADDWEILELHAEYVEHHLLSQVRVAAVGQEVDVWVLGRTRIRFKVVSTDPPAPAVLLSTDTEVSIAPKTRGTTSTVPSKEKARVEGSSRGYSSSLQTPRQGDNPNVVVLRVLPTQYYNAQADGNPAEPTALVSPATFQHLAKVMTVDLSDQPPRYTLVRVLNSPNAFSDEKKVTPASLPTPKVLRAADPSTTARQGAQENNVKQGAQQSFKLKASRSVPEKHVYLNPSAHHTLSGVGDWDLVRLSLTQEPAENPPEDVSVSTLAPTAGRPRNHQVLAGVDAILKQSQEYITQALATQSYMQASRRPSPSYSHIAGLLVCGAAGSGRTSVSKEIARRLEADERVHSYFLYVDLAKHSEDRVAILQSKFRSWLDVAVWHRPSVLILDNLEKVVGAEVEHADSFRSRHLAELFIATFAPAQPPPGVAIIATCQSQAAIHPLLSTSHIFGMRVVLKAPDKNARRDIISHIIEAKLSSADIQQDPQNPLNYVALATLTEGYSATDLKDLVGRAVHQCVIRSAKKGAQPILSLEDFTLAQVDFTPLSLRDVKLHKSDVLWSDIGGLQETRNTLRETLEWPTKYGAIFAKCPLRLRSGLLLYGYPGCGKTLLASAVAKECGLNFISVKGPELLNKYIGASEKSVRDLFDRASAAKPCVLFFDEFDSIAPKRGHDSTGVTDRVVNQMLTQMDGAEGLDGVYVLAATSRPDLIDPALLRPGRLDKSLLCDMPHAQDRLEIMQALSRKIAISPTVDLQELARQTEGFSGADLQALIYNAHLDVVHEGITAGGHISGPEAQTTPGGAGEAGSLRFTCFGEKRDIASKAEESALVRRMEIMMATSNRQKSIQKPVTEASPYKRVLEGRHLQKSLGTTRPSVSPEERYRLQIIYKSFVSERSGDLPVPPEGIAVGTRESLG